MSMPRKVLVVDDDRSFSAALGEQLLAAGYAVRSANSGAELLDEMGRGFEGVVLLDVKLPDYDGLELLGLLKPYEADIKVIVVTAYGTVGLAMTAHQEKGAFYVLSKTDGDLSERLPPILVAAFNQMDMAKQLRGLRESLKEQGSGSQIAHYSPGMKRVMSLIRQAADSKISVMIGGESGTGKELVARDLHSRSARGEGPFIAINCGGIPENLLESELFGYERGAFTGAYARKKGKFETADGGTLFLDEIGEMPLSLQVKLLRVLQSQEFERLGGTEKVTVDVRIISATNRDLAVEVAAGRFREDLFYRLAVFPIFIPALRERREDIMPLAEFFRQKYSKQENKETAGFTHDATQALLTCAYPGNVRQLENAIAHAVVVCRAGSPIDLADLPPTVRTLSGAEAGISGPLLVKLDQMIKSPSQLPSIQELEQFILGKAMKLHEGRIAEAARSLGIDRTTLYRKLKSGKVERDEP
jgi:DNA-binding NtrC family response regulator